MDKFESHTMFDEYFKKIIELIHFPVVIMDAEAHPIYINPRFTEVFGYTLEDIPTNEMWMEKAFPDEGYRQSVLAELGRIFASSAPIRYRSEVLRVTCKNGSIRQVIFNLYDLDEGKRSVIIEDVTKQAQAEKELKESEKRYRNLVETMMEGFGIQDENGKIIYVNDELCQMLGYGREELVGRYTLEFMDEDNRKIFLEQMNGKKAEGKTSYELEYIKKDGGRLSVIMSPKGIVGENGLFSGSFAVVTDITELKKAQAEKEKLISELQRALTKIKTLKGLVPICASCKKIRNDQGFWQQVDQYIAEHSDIDFTHGICPDCLKRLYPELYRERKNE